MATRLTAVPPRPAADERIETRTLALDTALELARTGELRDAKTLVALLLEARRRAAQA